MRARSGERSLPFPHLAVERELQLACPHGEVVEVDRRGLAQRNAPAEADVIAGKIGERGIGDLVERAVDIRAQRPGRRSADPEADARVGVDPAQVLQHQVGRAQGAGKLVAPGFQIAVEREARREALEADVETIGQQLRACIQQVALDPAVDQPRVDHFVAADHAADTGRDRQAEAGAVVIGGAVLNDVGQHGAIGIHAAKVQPVLDRQVAQPAVEHRRKARVIEHQRLAEECLVEQFAIELQVAHEVVAEIDQPLAIERQRGGAHREGAFEHRVHQRARRGQCNHFAQRLRGDALDIIARPRFAHDAILAGLVVDVEIQQVLAALDRQQFTRPRAPRAIAFQADRQVFLGAHHGGKEAARRCLPVEREVEHVAVRLGVHLQRKGIAAAELAIGVNEHAPVADVGLAAEVDYPFFAEDALGHAQVVHDQAIDANVEIGQQRRVGIAGQQFRSSVECRAVDDQVTDVQPAGEPAPGAPVEIDLRRLEEQGAVGIAQLHVMERGAPQDRPLDRADLDREAGSGSDLGDLVDDELAARRCVEEDHHRNQQRDDRGEDIAHHAQRRDPGRAATLFDHHGLGPGVRVGPGVDLAVLDRPLLRHQKAWPSAT